LRNEIFKGLRKKRVKGIYVEGLIGDVYSMKLSDTYAKIPTSGEVVIEFHDGSSLRISYGIRRIELSVEQ